MRRGEVFCLYLDQVCKCWIIGSCMSSLSGFSWLGDWRLKGLSCTAGTWPKTPWGGLLVITELSLLLAFEYILLGGNPLILFGLLYISPCILAAPSFTSGLFPRAIGGVECWLWVHTLLFLTQTSWVTSCQAQCHITCGDSLQIRCVTSE